MTDSTRGVEIVIDASVHDVFEYCRDPQHLFEGWSELEVTDVVMAIKTGVESQTSSAA